LQTFRAADLSKWSHNCQQAGLDGDALVLCASHGDPILSAHFPAIPLPAREGSLRRAVWLFLFADTAPARTAVLLALCLGAVLALGLLGRGGRTAALLVGLSVPLTWGALTVVRSWGHPPSPSHSVGHAAYAGDLASLRWLQVAVLVLVPCLIALLLVLGRRLRGAPAPLTESGPPVESGRWSRRAGLVGLALAAVAVILYCIPDLSVVRAGFSDPVPRNWDSDNWLVWQYLLQTGSLPFRDFWFPYSGQILYALPFPTGELVWTVNAASTFLVFLTAVYLCTGRSLLATLGVFGTLFGFWATGFCVSVERYLLVVNVALAYTVIDQQSRRLQWAHALFWVAVVQAGLMEPTSALYVGLPIALLEGVRWVRGGRCWRELCGRLWRQLAVPTAVFAGVLVWLAARGQLGGYVDFVLSLGDQANYGALPPDLASWLSWGSPVESFVVWSAVALTALGLAGLLARPVQDRRLSLTLLLLGLSCAALLLKQFVRPHMAIQITTIPVTGIALYLFVGARRFNPVQRHGAWLCGGLLLALLVASKAPATMLTQLTGGPARLTASLPLLTMDPQERRALVAERFAPARYEVSPGHRAVLQILAGAFAIEGKEPVFVLSDDAVFYPLLQMRPYCHTNFYNAAPIQEQRHMLRLLEERPPRYVIWRPSDPGMDFVPPVVRVPLLYGYVIEHYVPQVTLLQFEVLRRRLPGEPIALEFWRQRLGTWVQLGHIPRLAGLGRYRQATHESEEGTCEFLTVHVTDPAALFAAPSAQAPEITEVVPYYKAPGRTLVVPVDSPAGRFALALSVVPGQTEYSVRLDRVWFWRALRRAGLEAKLGEVPNGVELEIVRRKRRDDLLY
jgi:hypothetical protein